MKCLIVFLLRNIKIREITMKIISSTLLISLAFSAHAFNWEDLWLTPDQQGQKLMTKNQFKKAKETFSRSDWAAAAAYRAGDYQRASELYQKLKSDHGFYNQGNSLAHMGKYEEAIKAYNKALAINSNNQDALYNRKLIEALLKKDQKNQQNKDQQNQDQQSKDQQNKNQQNQNQQSKDQQSKNQQNKDQQNKNQESKNEQNKDQQNKNEQNTDQQKNDQKSVAPKNQDPQNKDKPSKDEQLNKDNQSEADREKQQAKEQWLRLIPDDPGGLLREKFLRDHLRRERGWN